MPETLKGEERQEKCSDAARFNPEGFLRGTKEMNVKEVDGYWLRKRCFYTGKNCIGHGITRVWWNVNSDKNEEANSLGVVKQFAVDESLCSSMLSRVRSENQKQRADPGHVC
ncbi:hypothetical protein SRHO_G00253720 [Serrasalmus rhombeus]